MIGNVGQFMFVGTCGALAGWLVSAEIAGLRCQVNRLKDDLGNLRKGMKQTVRVKLVKTRPKRPSEVYTKQPGETEKERKRRFEKLAQQMDNFGESSI